MELFNRLETQYGLPSGLLDSVWSAESDRGRNMSSPAGAKGHFQFMDATAQQYGVSNPNDLAQSATGAARMFSDLLKSTEGDVAKTLAAYNWGIGNVRRQGMQAAPRETKNYIQKVTASMGQPQTDSLSTEWESLNTQFGQATPKREAGADPWAELNAQFAPPAATAKPAQAASKASPEVLQPVDLEKADVGSGGNWLSSLNRGLARVMPFSSMAQSMRAGGMDVAAAKGAASGFADVGDTLLNAGTSVVAGLAPGIKRWNDDRASSLRSFNDENAGVSFSAGRIGGNIAATGPVGGAIGAGLRGAASLPMLSGAAPLLNALGASAASGGTRTGLLPSTFGASVANTGVRVAGGAAAGYGAAGLVDPSSAGLGAAIGGSLPPVVSGAGRLGGMVGGAIRSIRTPEEARAARAVLEAGGYKTADEVAAVRQALAQQGPSITGEGATVPQILQNEGVSQLQRTLRNSGDTAILEREAVQEAARMATLNRVSPISGTVQQSADNFGNALTSAVRPAEKEAGRQVRAAFDAVDPFNETRINLPLAEMHAARSKFLGPGTFGAGSKADAAIGEAERIGTEALQTQTAGGKLVTRSVEKAVPFQELQNLRSSLGEAAEQAALRGGNKEAAALRQMVADLDARAKAVMNGQGRPGEVFPPDVVKAWEKAIALHAEKMGKFHTGPQSAIFRKGGDGLPAADGGELAPKFFSPRGSQTADIASFDRIASPETRAALKNYAITDAASQTDRLGNLSNAKYQNWVNGRTGAINGLFGEGERAALQGVGADLMRADSAASLGMAKGSNTAQNVQNALGLGMLENPAVSILANRIPFVGKFTGPMLDGLRETAKRGKVKQLGGLLADPEALDRAIAASLSQSVRRPGLLDSGQLVPLLLRGAPVGGAGSGRQ